jgi:hypothetical protein
MGSMPEGHALSTGCCMHDSDFSEALTYKLIVAHRRDCGSLFADDRASRVCPQLQLSVT